MLRATRDGALRIWNKEDLKESQLAFGSIAYQTQLIRQRVWLQREEGRNRILESTESNSTTFSQLQQFLAYELNLNIFFAITSNLKVLEIELRTYTR